MSGSNPTILWIVLAVIVIALIIWWFLRSAAKRRELESRRLDAASLRARAADTAPVVQRRSDRASVTGAIAAEAEAEAAAAAREADVRAAEAKRLADTAERDGREAAAAQAEGDRLAREADRVDPDVKTDEAGRRVGEPAGQAASSAIGVESASAGGAAAGTAVPGTAGAAGVGAAVFTNEEDEPDLADAENPFAEPSPDQVAGPDSPPVSPETVDDEDDEDGAYSEDGDVQPDWINDPVDEDAADEGKTHDDSESADWINGPPADEPAPAQANEPSVGEEHVSVPALDDRDQAGEGHTPSDDPGDHRGLPWSTSPGEVGPGEGAAGDDDSEADAPAATPEAAPEAAEEATPVDEAPETGAEADEGQVTSGAGAEGGPREVSRLDEVRDGGYGVGSAAPVFDGAQPLGHPIKAWRDTMTFVAPGGEGYDGAGPDVWFFNEDAARAAGFRDASA